VRGYRGGMGENPKGEGSEPTAVGPGRVGEGKAAEATGRDARGGGAGGDELPWGEDEERTRGPGRWDGQPNLEPDPPVAGEPTRLSPGSRHSATSGGSTSS
jgi:hypothetical protein